MSKTKGIAAMPDLLTVNQAAALMSVIPRRIRALLERGRLPGINYGHQWLIKRDDLAVYMVAREARLRGTAWDLYLLPKEKRKRIRIRRKRSPVVAP
jgi:excisionase family DNA binding protein